MELTGRNRYRACLAAGVEPTFVPWKGQQPLPELALSLNLRRRHLDESQRALVAARLAKMMEKEATKRKGWRRDDMADLPYHQYGTSRGKAAALVNVSPRLVSCAIKVLRDGCDELIAAVESGRVAVTPASSLAGLHKDEQAKVVAGGAQEIARKFRELRARKNVAAPPSQVSRGSFGLLRAPGRGEIDPVALLWVDSGAVLDAVEGLKAWGFRYTPPDGKK